jgi:hypothetical protein
MLSSAAQRLDRWIRCLVVLALVFSVTGISVSPSIASAQPMRSISFKGRSTVGQFGRASGSLIDASVFPAQSKSAANSYQKSDSPIVVQSTGVLTPTYIPNLAIAQKMVNVAGGHLASSTIAFNWMCQ